MIVRNNPQSLFTFEGDKLQVNPRVLLIPEFAYLYERDHSIGKKKAMKEFGYVYYIADYKSEYNAYGLSKESQISLDIMGTRAYAPDQHVKAAIDKYSILQETPSMRYLISLRQRVNKIISFLDSAEIDDKDGDKYKNPFISIDRIAKTMTQLEDTLESIEKWEKKVFEEEEEMKIRGGGALNVFENPEDAKWITKK